MTVNKYTMIYQNKYAKQGNMTPEIDGKTADRMNIEQLIERLKDETYQSHPARRVYIPKKNGKESPLGIPSFEDKFEQERISEERFTRLIRKLLNADTWKTGNFRICIAELLKVQCYNESHSNISVFFYL